MSDTPDIKKICHAQYTYKFKMYVESDGTVIAEGEESSGRIKSITKTDAPMSEGTAIPLLFPDLRMSILLENDEYLAICNNKNDLIISLAFSVTSKRVDVDNGIVAGSDTGLFDQKFQCIMDASESTDIPSSERAEVEKQNDVVTTQDANSVYHYRAINFRLSCIEHRNRFKKAINFNMSKEDSENSITVAMALAYGISSVITTEKSVIFQNPDITTSYMQIISPILNLKNFCYHIQTVYGAYNNGIIVYQDLLYFYVIPCYSEKYAIAEKTYNSVHIYILESSASVGVNNTGYYCDEEKSRYVVITAGPKTYAIADGEEYIKETKGNIFKLFSYNNDIASVTYEEESWGGSTPYTEHTTTISGSTKIAEDKIRHFYDDFDNPALINSHVFDLASKAHTVYILVNDVDMSIFTFNRSYKLIFKNDISIDARYGGMYRLYKVSQYIKGDGNNPMTSHAFLTLLKIS